MVNHGHISLLAICFAHSIAAYAISPSTILSPPLETDPNVASVKFNMADNPLAPPSLRLNSDDSITLSFDILSSAHSQLRAELLHFNSDWTPSSLLPSEYNHDWNEASINDFQYSAPVFTPYVNYRVSLPSDGLRPAVSGNFAIRIFPEENPDSTVLKFPFDVSENSMPVNLKVSSDTRAGFNSGWQELEVKLTGALPSSADSFSQLWLVVDQNLDPSTTKVVMHPSRVNGNEFAFADAPGLLFPAGNEFRRFDTLQTDHPGLNVEQVKFENGSWHSYLSTDLPRVETPYIYDSTQHGEFVIDDFNSTDPDLGADYVRVHFSLDMPRVNDAEIFVDGGFTHHTFTNLNRMKWNHEKRLYEVEIPLKQGSYNYRYVLFDGTRPDWSPIEGNHFETENAYRVKVFCRPLGSRHDRLLSVYFN